MSAELLLIDVSSIAFPIYEMSGREPDPDHVATQIAVKVRQLASQYPHAALCLDSGRSFRHDLEPTYKANRDTSNRAALVHQITNACETLRAEGFPVWSVTGCEADDVIASAVAQALAIDDTTVLIASADKDLAQLVSDRVRIKSTHPKSDGTVRGPAEVLEKFGVYPHQMLDYLCLVGDASDNVKGADGIGAKRAAELLSRYGSLENIYAAFDKGATPPITPAQRTSLQNFRARWPLVRQLIALKDDALTAVQFAEIAVEREAKAMIEDGELPSDVTPERGQCAEYFADAERVSRELTAAESSAAISDATRKVAERIASNEPKMDGAVTAYREAATTAPRQELVPAAPRDYSQELEPRDMNEAIRLAQRMYDSRLFGAYGTPQAVLSTILAGRELGMGAMKALRSFHIIEGKPAMSADLIAGQVLASGRAKYFRPLKRTDTEATFSTLRIGDGEEPFVMTYTIEDARRAWKRDQRAWDNSGWGKNPADMLVARCKSKLARLVYPDVVSGLYAPEEFDA